MQEGECMIQLNKEQFRTGTQAMMNCGEALATAKCQVVNMTGNSEPLRNYIECFEKLQIVMNAYATLLQKDGESILSAGEALVQEDRDILVVAFD